jgi:hypothetical protein
MKKLYLLITFLCLFPLSSSGQSTGRHQAYVEAGGLAASTERTPFWLRANQFGTVPYTAPVGTVRAGIGGLVSLTDTVRKTRSRAWLLHYGAEAVGNVGKENQFVLPAYYIQLMHRQVQLTIGRRREVIGLVDSSLTSGSYAWSGNALPIPKIQFGTRGFAPLGRRQWLAVNAFMAHGWFANTNYMQHSFLHQKSVILRVGKPTSPVHVYAGINHSAQWGGHSAYLDPRIAVNGQLPGQLRDFPNVLFSIRTGGIDNPRITSFDYINMYGNHVGSTDIGLDIQLPTATLLLYHQHSFDDASGVMFQNFPDGLTGLRLRPRTGNRAGFRLNSILVEFLSTLNQSGPAFYQANTHTKGADNYFNNAQYQEGWTYKGYVIGTPFLSRREDVKTAYRNTIGWAIVNNRVQVLHFGMQATVATRIALLTKIAYSRNYGLMDAPLAGTPAQWSALLQLGMPTSWLGGVSLTASVAADYGQLFTNSIGTYVGLRKVVWSR